MHDDHFIISMITLQFTLISYNVYINIILHPYSITGTVILCNYHKGITGEFSYTMIHIIRYRYASQYHYADDEMVVVHMFICDGLYTIEGMVFSCKYYEGIRRQFSYTAIYTHSYIHICTTTISSSV